MTSGFLEAGRVCEVQEKVLNVVQFYHAAANAAALCLSTSAQVHHILDWLYNLDSKKAGPLCNNK